MRNARIGGVLVTSGWALVVVGVGLSYIAGSLIGGATMSAGTALVGAGALVLAITGPVPLTGRVVRISLGILAIGLFGFVGSSIAAARLSYDALSDGPTVILLIGGGLATFIGMLLTQLSLLVAGGLARRLGALFFGGLVSIYLAQGLAAIIPDASPIRLAASLLTVAAGAAFVVGCSGPGLLALRGDRTPVGPRP